MPQKRTPHTAEEVDTIYAQHVNAQWVRLLNVLGINQKYRSALGTELIAEDGTAYLDFLCGYGVYNVGHHHPSVNAALKHELDNPKPTMLQSYVPELAAELAERLVHLAGGRLCKVFFTNTGSEGVESVIKFARARTSRDGVLYSSGAFHGLTCGALSLMSNPWWREGFGPLLAYTQAVPFNDLNALEDQLRSKKFGAFITEPIQAESGVQVPDQDYLLQAQGLCRRYGTLFVVDEVQTGMFRTGRFLASHHYGVEPDMVVLAKAMSGGYVPVGALLMSDEIRDAVYSSIDRSFVHSSTFGENALAMRAALATLDVLEGERLGERATVLGERLRSQVNKLSGRYEMLKEARGLGLMSGIEFQAPKSTALKLLFHGFKTAHPGLFGQMMVRHLFQRGHILLQMCGNNYMVLKPIPPLVTSETQIDTFVAALESMLETIHFSKADFWPQGIAIGKQALLG